MEIIKSLALTGEAIKSDTSTTSCSPSRGQDLKCGLLETGSLACPIGWVGQASLV